MTTYDVRVGASRDGAPVVSAEAIAPIVAEPVMVPVAEVSTTVDPHDAHDSVTSVHRDTPHDDGWRSTVHDDASAAHDATDDTRTDDAVVAESHDTTADATPEPTHDATPDAPADAAHDAAPNE